MKATYLLRLYSNRVLVKERMFAVGEDVDLDFSTAGESLQDISGVSITYKTAPAEVGIGPLTFSYDEERHEIYVANSEEMAATIERVSADAWAEFASSGKQS